MQLNLVVFICGASVMILELVSSRIFAPYVGTSVFVWTNLIGIILAFLSLGYALGGKIADRNPQKSILSRIIFVAALWIAGLPLVSDAVLLLIEKAVRDIRLQALIGSVILLAFPSFLLGIVTPYAAKLKLSSLEEAGAAVGRLYALSTLGSIGGTFLAGFVLLSYFGNMFIFFILSASLILASLLLCKSQWGLKVFFLAAFIFLASSSEALARGLYGPGLLDKNTAYGRVWIYTTKNANQENIKVMQINDEISSMRFEHKEDLAAIYTAYYRLGGHFYPQIKNSLMLGGAGYSYPMDFLSQFQEASMDVVEIDPGVTELAKKHFRLKENPRLSIYHEDARTFLNRNSKTYNVIFGDVFRSAMIPFHLTTLETIKKIHNSLSDDGVFIINSISSVEGKTGQFFRAEIATLKKVFPQVYVFAVGNPEDGALVQNLIIVALKSEKIPKFYSRDFTLHQYLQRLWIRPIPEDMPVLTDDFAPVERYSVDIINSLLRIKNPILAYWEERFKKKKPQSP